MNVSAINCQSCFAPLNLDNTKSGICTCEFCNTQHNLSKELTIKVRRNSQAFVVRLVHFMIDNMNLQDIAELTYTMSGDLRIQNYLDWDNIRHETLSCAARELTGWCQRRGCLDVLIAHVASERPSLYIELL